MSSRASGSAATSWPSFQTREIPEDLLLPICREFNYSETTFVYPAEQPSHTAPPHLHAGGEVPFAGHPTVGTAVVLAAIGGNPGDRRGDPHHLRGKRRPGSRGHSRLAHRGWMGAAERGQASRGRPAGAVTGVIARMLGLETGDLLGTSEKPQAVSCGLPFLIVPLTGVDALGRARVKVDRWEETLANAWASMIWVYAADPDGGELHYRARMFAPGISVPEDPATGSAAAAFAGYLAARSRIRGGTLRWTIDQGVEMGRPSRLEIEADKADGAVSAIRVGGSAVLVSEGTMDDGRVRQSTTEYEEYDRIRQRTTEYDRGTRS